MKLIKYPTVVQAAEALRRPAEKNYEIREKAQKIIDAVRIDGDKALLEFALKFDRVNLNEIKVSEDEFNEVEKRIDEKLCAAIDVAYKNIYKFHAAQKSEFQEIEIDEGITCRRKSVPIEKVGLYVPGGSSPLFSTLLMLAIPAQIAGCDNIAVCSPPQKNGAVADSILYVAKRLGIKNVFKTGGAQAIAALAFGTESVPKVFKIFGPGNQWVTAAKQAVNSLGVAIDLPAGPSEVLVIADDTADARFAAADLLSQAEHGPDSQAILISTSENFILSTASEIEKLKNRLPRKEIIDKALENGAFILVKNIKEAIEISNNYAPEHLILSVNGADEAAEQVVNAGSVFLGNYSPEAAGDYASGANHTLPTSGFAKAYGGLSVKDFTKEISFQKLTPEGLNKIAKAIETMAEAEGLAAHKLAVEVRRNYD
ncbi:MAG: histidinol dehydrogenase [Chlorobi bacterium]|nr:histidinol dehydrogenase [Chlorobiota bacterium]